MEVYAFLEGFDEEKLAKLSDVVANIRVMD